MNGTNPLRLLRLELGQTQDALVQRALASGRVRPTFHRTLVVRAEAPKPIGLRSHEVRLALAYGLGLTVDDLDSYLDGRLTLTQAIARSSIKPDKEAVKRLKEAEEKRALSPKPHAAGAAEPRDPMPALRAALDMARQSGLPAAYVAAYEQAARASGRDRPPFEWVDDIRAQLGPWKRGDPTSWIRMVAAEQLSIPARSSDAAGRGRRARKS